MVHHQLSSNGHYLPPRIPSPQKDLTDTKKLTMCDLHLSLYKTVALVSEEVLVSHLPSTCLTGPLL